MISETFDDQFCYEQLIKISEEMKALDGKGLLISSKVPFDCDEENDVLDRYFGKSGKRRTRAGRFYFVTKEILSHILPSADFFSLYKGIIHWDWMAQASTIGGARYRDHIFHPPRVAVLAFWLMKHCPPLSIENLATGLAEEYRGFPERLGLTLPNWTEIARYSVLISALLHDICRPLEFKREHAQSRGVFLELRPQQTLKAFLKEIEDSPFLERVRPYKIRVATRKSSCHGPLGALNILAMAHDSRTAEHLTWLISNIAAEAVSYHHNKPLPFVTSPVRYILALADSLQEFGREVAVFDYDHVNECHTIFLLPDAARMSVQSDGQEVHFSFHLSDAATRERTRFDIATCKNGKKSLQADLNCNGDALKIVCGEEECFILPD